MSDRGVTMAAIVVYILAAVGIGAAGGYEIGIMRSERRVQGSGVTTAPIKRPPPNYCLILILRNKTESSEQLARIKTEHRRVYPLCDLAVMEVGTGSFVENLSYSFEHYDSVRIVGAQVVQHDVYPKFDLSKEP